LQSFLVKIWISRNSFGLAKTKVLVATVTTLFVVEYVLRQRWEESGIRMWWVKITAREMLEVVRAEEVIKLQVMTK